MLLLLLCCCCCCCCVVAVVALLHSFKCNIPTYFGVLNAKGVKRFKTHPQTKRVIATTILHFMFIAVLPSIGEVTARNNMFHAKL